MIIPQLGTRSLDNGMPMLTFILLGLGAICSSTQSIDLAIRGSPSMLRATKATSAMSLLTALLGLLRMVTQVVMPMIGSKLYLRPPLDSKLRGFGSFIARNSSTGGMAWTYAFPHSPPAHPLLQFCQCRKPKLRLLVKGILIVSLALVTCSHCVPPANMMMLTLDYMDLHASKLSSSSSWMPVFASLLFRRLD